ncbi:MAG TPA: hypothetical protein VF618_27700 [Thermoanaerobaculia bacterium]
MRNARSVLLIALLLSTSAFARVVSYAPYSDRFTYPALQHRNNRYIVLLEAPALNLGGTPWLGAPIVGGLPVGQLVVYDTTGEEEARVVYPAGGDAVIGSIGVRRNDPSQTLTIAAQIQENGSAYKWVLSSDSGRTWVTVTGTPNRLVSNLLNVPGDTGGPHVRARYAPLRIGSADYPFVFLSNGELFAIRRTGSAKNILSYPGQNVQLAGSDLPGSRFLVRLADSKLVVVGLDGVHTPVGEIDPRTSRVEGWITSDGGVYVEQLINERRYLHYFKNGTRQLIAGPHNFPNPPAPGETANGVRDHFFAVPTADFSGAWFVQRGTGVNPTTLSVHIPELGGVRKQWDDATQPQIEAIHAGASLQTLLIQVHRERPMVQATPRIDPALAVWRIGQPAPRSYDELYLNELPSKAFVHVNPDTIESGAPFVFDSGVAFTSGGGGGFSSSPPAGGGGDVIQEWGVVRGSLKQRLVLPGVARTEGAFGSFWLTDVILYNPADTQQSVAIRYVPTGQEEGETRTLTLAPREIRLVNDALKSIFNLESGGGVFYVEPQSGMNVVARTYNKATKGTFGFGMTAIDAFNATTARFPVTFSGAFNGDHFRTNLIIADAEGFGSEAGLGAVGLSGDIGVNSVAFRTPRGGQQQLNSIAQPLGVSANETGALLIRPSRGSAIASVFAIDNRTNDPTYFPPDLATTGIMRSIPVIGHVDGANNSQFRSDLYLFNPTQQPVAAELTIFPWGEGQSSMVALTLLPREARVIRDVLSRVFNRTGIARLRVIGNGIRFTSRTYSIDENGGTYGFLMPPLNAFQVVTPGETLELLGSVIDPAYRTNIGIVEMSNAITGGTAQARIDILIPGGAVLDSFTVTVPIGRGMQVNDVFQGRGLTGEKRPVLIRVTGLSGVIGSYVTMNDNGTNDPTYLPAYLGARPN